MNHEARPKDQLPTLTQRIVATYHSIDRINHLGHLPLPNFDAVVEIIELLKEVIFPGFRRRQGLHLGNVGYYVGDVLDGLFDKLTVQIGRAIRHEAQRSGQPGAEALDFDQIAQEKTLRFLERIPEVRELLATDAQAAFEGDPATSGTDEVIFCYPGLQAISVFRLAHVLYQLRVPFIPRMMTEWAHSQTGIDIHPGATIGHSFFIDHGTGVVVGQTCVIGNHVKLYQGVTLGALSFARDADGDLLRGENNRRHPTLEDNVVIYANATVLGGATTIGHDSVIGSSVWITRSVAPRSTVVLEKPRLRIREEHQEPVLDYQI